ncbi:unnamed protein product, partial [Didymodactylos carnosus]
VRQVSRNELYRNPQPFVLTWYTRTNAPDVFTAPLQQILTNFQVKLATTRDSTFQLTNEPSLELQSAVKLLLRQNTMWDMNIKSLCWAVASNYICDTCEHGK